MTAIDDDRSTTPRWSDWIGAVIGWFEPTEPRPTRGPFARWPRVTDGMLAAVVLAGSLLAVALSAIGEAEDLTLGSIGDRPAAALALLAIGAASVLWRRSHPLVVTAVVLATMVVWAVAGYGDGHDLALVVALYSVGRYCTSGPSSVAAVGLGAALSSIGTVIDASQRVDIVPAILLTAVPWYVGRRLRNRGEYLSLLQERAERLELEQLARARQAVVDERSRIARELHDVVAHRVSMMTVQAGAAKTIAPHDPAAAIEAMGDVEGAGRQALGELRHLLGVLRPESGVPDHLGPQPGLADVPALVDQLRHAGAEVTMVEADLPDDLAAAVDLSAYRIVQESLTNIIKHAGPGPVVDIAVGIEGDHLTIEVVNTTDGAPATLPTSGFGLAGMAERASLLGGTLTAGPGPGRQYRVEAHLPVGPGPT